MKDDKTKPTSDHMDYPNTYMNVYAVMGDDLSHKNFKVSLAKSPVETVDEYFERKRRGHTGKDDPWAHNFKADMNRFPERVKRLNELAVLANKCTTVKKLDMVYEEVDKLIYGDKSRK